MNIHRSRFEDGSAGDVDYAEIGEFYSRYRRPDPRIAARVHAALGAGHRVLNVGAGAGSYEPNDRRVVAVEPSASMRAQRPRGHVDTIDAYAEDLPFRNGTFDAAMTTFSVHQWQDCAAGLRELRRVTRGPVVVLTCDPSRVRQFWLNAYAPEVLEVEQRRYPSIDTLANGLGGRVTVTMVPIPLDCTDGFNEAYYGRPEALLDPRARLCCSSWSKLDADLQDRFAKRLTADLETHVWDRQWGLLRSQPTLRGSLVLVVSTPESIHRR